MASSSSPSSSSWEPPLPAELHRMLPQYEITGILGRGGMGAVYKGRQAKLNRDVAIKVLPETLAQGGDDLNFAARFAQEAQAMARLDHPAIISVHDFGETPEGLLYFVMEFVDGVNIQQFIQHHEGKVPQEHALSITAHVLDALGYAHRHGIVHRDIKPANILLNQEGRVKIADFGLAKRFGEHADLEADLTMTNMAVGTPIFIAPEAMETGRKVDHRADLYAVGVMLYQMLTGKLPRGHFEMPSQAREGIDSRLDAVVTKAMAADPDHRYASAEAIRADIDAILSHPMTKLPMQGMEGKGRRVMKMVQAPQGSLPAGRSAARSAAPSEKSVSSRKAPSKSVPRPSLTPPLLWVGVGGLLLLGGILALVLPGKKTSPSHASPPAKVSPTNSQPKWAVKNPPATTPKIVVTTPPKPPLPPSPKPAPLRPPPASTTTVPAEAAEDRPFINSLGMMFVPVPSTEILMCIHETRNQDYAAYAKENPEIDTRWNDPKFLQLYGIPVPYSDDCPVVLVNGSDAQAFCAWLTRKDGRIYRLPSDREWSIAVGIGPDESQASPDATPESLRESVKKMYPWGTAWPPPVGAGNLADESGAEIYFVGDKARYIKGYRDGFPGLSPVMSFIPNDLGIFDLAGNVREWCEDLYSEEATTRTVRGSDWSSEYDKNLWSSFRMGTPSNTYAGRGCSQGFRVVLVP